MSRLDQLDAIRFSYDRAASNYSALVLEDLSKQPVEEGLLAIFAKLAAGGRVADVGSGPGQLTAFLHSQGLDVFGIDLSPKMVEQAKTNFPEITFEVGSMDELRQADRSLSGVLAWLSIIHVPDRELPQVLREFHRVLVPEAPVLLAFQMGDGSKHLTEQWGTDIDLTLYRRRPDAVNEMLAEAGFRVVMTTVFEPAGRPGVQVACIIALRA